MTRAWIISIGTELSLGQSVDTNSGWIAQQLAAIGVRCDRHVTVADELRVIVDVLLEAADSCELLIVTGGLGPTDDDLTREAVARAAGVELVSDAESVRRLEDFFERRARPMPRANLSQTLVPEGGRAIENTCGTAPGVFIKIKNASCYGLPGVPFEMKAMFVRSVLPEIREDASGSVIRTRLLHCCGLGESGLGERLADLMERGRNPEVGTTAKLGLITVRMNAVARSVDKAEHLLDRDSEEIERRLGAVVYGRDDESMASVVGRALLEAGATVSTAESCTGGMLGSLLTDVPGSSAYYVGGAVVYSNALKESFAGVGSELVATHGAVSEPVAEALASGVRARTGSTYALSITGIAGPGGGSAEKPVGLVFVGVAGPKGVEVFRFLFGDDAPRDVIRQRAANAALNQLRLALSGVGDA